ncbi:MAG: hypothetical protein UT14_C0033G0017 [Candidatus Shapirobacteria bacterium GW2011_GWE1_38_92]|uniref:Uncharacterized protein n=1 Tax=Candidatus Shapirobacteria bacterium GW2011_GWE1_38_92 TaxID=1618489 RepID=A0A0G0LHW8_9BACT|nr:MAG: hypothetical protein UT14_C0033G0017 [Candidatus Shapirobacteria bacterium GW2011_GWE1_38_92]
MDTAGVGFGNIIEAGTADLENFAEGIGESGDIFLEADVGDVSPTGGGIGSDGSAVIDLEMVASVGSTYTEVSDR